MEIIDTGRMQVKLPLKIDKQLRSELRAELALPRIILAEDNAELRSLIAISLEKRGIQVIQSANGKELYAAYERFSNQPDQIGVDLVITDIRMPVLSGFSAIEKIRSKNSFVKIVAITAFGSEDTIAEAKRVGADLTVCKPIDVARFSECIRKFLA